MEPPIEFIHCASCFQQQCHDTDDIVYIELDMAMKEACYSVPFGRTGGLRITAGHVAHSVASLESNKPSFRVHEAGHLDV